MKQAHQHGAGTSKWNSSMEWDHRHGTGTLTRNGGASTRNWNSNMSICSSNIKTEKEKRALGFEHCLPGNRIILTEV